MTTPRQLMITTGIFGSICRKHQQQLLDKMVDGKFAKSPEKKQRKTLPNWTQLLLLLLFGTLQVSAEEFGSVTEMMCDNLKSGFSNSEASEAQKRTSWSAKEPLREQK